MQVVFNQSMASQRGVYSRGQVVDLPDSIAGPWIASGHASSVEHGDSDEADDGQYSGMTVAELREAAKAEDLSTNGTKAELLARLRGE